MDIAELVNVRSFLRAVSTGRFGIGAGSRFGVGRDGGRGCWEKRLIRRGVRRMGR